MTRREALLLGSAARMLGQTPSTAVPSSFSYPIGDFEGILTPAELFFVRDHFPEPELSLSTWRLKIQGRVASPLELSFADILESPTAKLEAVLECAGNPANGSAAGNGQWEGVPLANLLTRARVLPDATAVMLEGADSGRLYTDSPELPYCQLVPLAKCLQPESLAAFKLNDRFLGKKNGFPLRALFPGWYGMNSVKWLQRLVVLSPSDQVANFHASGIDKLYNRVIETPSGNLQVARLSVIQVRSVISWPPDDSRLPRSQCRVRGFAWTGEGRIQEVRLTVDGGRTWVSAQVEKPSSPFGWVKWNYTWLPTSGAHLLMSRAIDDKRREQPLLREPARKDGYELNYCAPIRCSVW